ncbi:cell cycle checkpoint control protein RAD9A isoform X3 [Passer montanus]|uniref:cell cycle checkpoint control protein RAD9A isoform X3 n=1 Tax=Passer montanus TaxID=9160 RepID=UPI001961403D|nr:cell cycle checkpoint control protein RAD9A isoform X3 [Passer montanus]
MCHRRRQCQSPRPSRALPVPHRRRALPGAHREWAVPPCCQLLPFCLRLLPLRTPLLPAVRAGQRRARRGALPMQSAHEVLPGRIPLAALAGEVGGEVPHPAQAPCQPPGPAAPLQVRVLAEAVVHFPLTLAEVTLGTGPGGKISLRNYVEDEAEPSKTMVTELWLAEDEFQSVAVAPGSHITFCLKEFRGLLSFAEASNLPLTIHFDEPGRPVIFTLDDTVLEVHLVLATLSDLESKSQSPSTNGESHLPAPSDDFADDLESYMAAMETSEGCSEGPPSPPFPLRTPQPAKSKPQEEEEEEEGAVPGTPPHKKFRSLFFGSVMTPGKPGPATAQEVLAEDSDGES